jgi:tetratricopeptide (TPR) repeat protein
MSGPELPSSISPIEDAVSLHRQGRLDEAEKIYRRLIKVDRNDFNALHLFGMLNHQRGKPGEAYRLITSALKIHPRSPDALANLALVLHALKRGDEALATIDKALALAPDHLDAINNRGNLLLELKRPAEAVAAFDRLLEREPRHVQGRINRGNALSELGRGEEALAEYNAALALQPGNPSAFYNQGNALRALDREAEAIEAYGAALLAMPSHVSAWINLGLALMALNRADEALAAYGKALELAPDNADANFNEGLARLTAGDYRHGFEKYEWRWKRTGMDARPRFRQRPWLGEIPVANKTILLHAEQGLGDTIQFARYATTLARAGAKVMIEAQPELKELLSTIEGVRSVVGRGETLPPFDLQCPLASLPLAFKTELSNVPAEIPYLRASEDRIARWRRRLEAIAAPRIAIAWSGRETHINDRNRSIALSQLEPLLASPGVHFVSIQRELRPADAGRLAGETRIVHVGGDLADFSDTAAVLALCDLTISVDTSVAHLAAAMGRPTYVLIPFQPDWRWTVDGDRSPWYPQARLFRQPAPGDWKPVLTHVSEELAKRRSPVT